LFRVTIRERFQSIHSFNVNNQWLQLLTFLVIGIRNKLLALYSTFSQLYNFSISYQFYIFQTTKEFKTIDW